MAESDGDTQLYRLADEQLERHTEHNQNENIEKTYH